MKEKKASLQAISLRNTDGKTFNRILETKSNNTLRVLYHDQVGYFSRDIGILISENQSV